MQLWNLEHNARDGISAAHDQNTENLSHEEGGGGGHTVFAPLLRYSV